MENKFKGMLIDNINKLTLENEYFRRVIYTDMHQQIVLMSLLPSEDIGVEIHPGVSQFIRIEKGEGIAHLDWGNGLVSRQIGDDSFIEIPAGTYHNIINTSKTNKLKLYTIYSPPNHPADKVNMVKPSND